jgi:TatD DNase family protein
VSLLLNDTHCHLNFEAFDLDREQVIERARKVGIAKILNPGVDLATSQSAVKLAEEYIEVFAAVGIHPNSATEWNRNTLKELKSLASHPKVVAIGEIGLDYYRDFAPKDEQKRVFLEQLALAAEMNLPVVIHNRQASVDMINLLSEWCVQLEAAGVELVARPGVLHSFSADSFTADKALSIGFMIGISGPVTFHNAANLQSLVELLPTERLLIETDAPFLAPHPLRGQRNEPAYVVKIAEKISSLHEISLEEVANITTANAERLFNWRVSN